MSLHFGVYVSTEEAPERAVMVLAEHDHLGANPSGRFDDRRSRLASGPGEVRIEPG